MNKNIETFIGCDKDYDISEIVIFGAPFDGTTSFRPGTRFAPKAMRSESFGIETYSPYQDKDLSDLKVFDAGDIELVFGNTEKALKQIEDFTDNILKDNKIPLMIGGEHLVTLGAVKSLIKKYPDLNIVHFDAHADLRDDYLGEKLSHSTVMKRCFELTGKDRIFQFGIRSGDKSEFEFAVGNVIMNKYDFNRLTDTIIKLKGKPVYFSIDLDVLDPSLFPGTGTPEAGGVGFTELLNAVISVGKLNIVGCDINELSPVYDQSGVSTAVACKVLRELIISVYK